MADELEPRHEDALRRIYEADKARGGEGGEFMLYFSGEGPEILHGGWDPSWALPSPQTIDDLGELGLLRVASPAAKGRTFGLSISGRRRAAELIELLSQPSAEPRVSQDDAFASEERRANAQSASAELELAIDAFLAQIGLDLFTAEDLADAVPVAKFDLVAASRWLRAASGEGRVTPMGGRWQVTEKEAGEGPSYHVRVAPVDARDLLSGPIYALDLSEAEAIQRFIAPYQSRAPLNHGDRTFASYRKPKVTQLYGSGAETVATIRHRLARSRRVHAAHEAEEMFFKQASRDVTDTYIGAGEPESVRTSGSAPGADAIQPAQNRAAAEVREGVAEVPAGAEAKPIFVVHGHQRKDEVARFLRRVTGMEPIVLGERAGRGRTIIEKFEEEARPAAYAVVLLTEDDVGKATDAADLRPRARQNAILELGYFIGKIGRENVAVLHEEKVEILSDYQGVEYISFAENWQTLLMRELREAGVPIDPAGI